MLAKRLIHNLSVSMDAEENMINRLKVTSSSRLNSALQGCPRKNRFPHESNFSMRLRVNLVVNATNCFMSTKIKASS